MVFLHMCFWFMVSKSHLYQLVRSDRASIVKRGWFLEPANQWLSISSHTFGFGSNSSLTDPLCGLSMPPLNEAIRDSSICSIPLSSQKASSMQYRLTTMLKGLILLKISNRRAKFKIQGHRIRETQVSGGKRQFSRV